MIKLKDLIKEDISMSQLDVVEKHLDKIWAKVGIDVEFTRHFHDRVNDARNGKPNWTWGVTFILFVLIAWLSSIREFDDDLDTSNLSPLTLYQERFAKADGFEKAHEIVQGRCAMCHAREPAWQGLRWAPNGILLETPADVAKNAYLIYVQAGISHAMPPGNITNIPKKDRTILIDWYRSVE